LVELGVNNTTTTESRETRITIDASGDSSMCHEHPNQPKDVFCLDCQMAICSQCGCFSAQHKNHELKPFSVVYGEQVRRLRQQIDELVEREAELIQLTTDAVLNIDEIEKSQEKHVRDLRKFVNDQMNKLNAEKKEKIASIQQNRQKLQDEIERIRETIQETNNKIVNLPKDTLVLQRADISDARSS